MSTAVHNFEPQVVTVTFALQVFDGFSGAPKLLGSVAAQVDNREKAMLKAEAGQFLFFQLGAGACTVHVASDALTPYYLPAALNLTLPMTTALWPGFPDRAIADPALPLDDLGQPAAYRAQRVQATMQPAVAYPFPLGANLVRGTVLSAGVPLAGATVSVSGGDAQYLTGSDGQYVLFFLSVTGTGQAETLQATHPAHTTVSVAVTLRRGSTIAQDFVMA
jgi:hypothetical protein